MKNIFLILVLFANTTLLFAQKITVAKDGSGNYKTIQEAINSLDTVTTKQRTIFIKNGLYPD
jgi:pectinesterase